MKDKINLWQIEKGDELKNIGEKVNRNEVVLIEGDQDIYDLKNFKKNPRSEEHATSKYGLVPKEQMDIALGVKANKDQVLNKVTEDAQEVAGPVRFNKVPRSTEDATNGDDLVRKSQYDVDLGNKVDKDGSKGLSEEDFTTTLKNKLDNIEVGAEVNTVDSVNGKTGVVTVTKSDVDLGNADNTSDADKPVSTAQQTELDKKVDKVTGKGLSEFDYNQTEKDKVAKGVIAHGWGNHEDAGYAKDNEVVKITEKGEPGGVAELDDDGKVPVSQLPSFVSDVLEFDTLGDFPATGESAVIYVAKDTNKTYRWSGTGYVVIGDGDLVLGETSDTAYRGDRGKSAYDHSKKASGNPHNVTKSDVGLGNADNTSDADKPVSTAQQTELDKKVDKVTGKELSTNDFTTTLKNKLDNIEAGAEVNTVDSVNGKTGAVTVTKSDVSLGNADNTSDADKPVSTAQQTELDKKVDKVAGKELSTNDFTNVLKGKLDNVEEGAQVNVQSDYLEANIASDTYIKNKAATVTVEDDFEWSEGDSQIFDVQYKASKLLGCFVNGQRLSKNQIDIRANGYEILTTMYGNNTITILYEHDVIWENIYGCKYDWTIAAPEVHYIGNSALNQSKPILQKFRRCTLNDDGTVNYYLDSDNSAKKEDGVEDALLDGTDGQVMVRVPRHYRLNTLEGNVHNIAFSLTPFPGAIEVKEYYHSAFEASEDRTNGMLASVRNLTERYRGGGNQSAWDNEAPSKSQLGKPVTSISRVASEKKSNARGEGWIDQDMHHYETLVWLQIHDFGTLNTQSVFEGVTNLSSSEWSDFNGYYPVVQCGSTISLGNNSGEIEVVLQDYPTIGQTRSVKTFSWRGIENFYGHIWKWVNGVNIIDNQYYLNPRYRKKRSNIDADGYYHIGSRPTSNGYIKELFPGTILPKELGGSSSTFYADYLYTNTEESIRAVRVGGPGIHGTRAGAFATHTHIAPTSTNAYSGARLCFQP